MLYTRPASEQGADALWSIDANGRDDRRVLVCTGGCGMYNLTASSDGSQIAYLATYPNGSSQVRLVAPDGSGDRMLLADASGVGFPTISPDGSRLAFTKGRPSEETFAESSLWIVDTAGGTPRELVSWQGVPMFPAWQDDAHLLYTNRSGSIMRVATDGDTPPQQVLAEGTVLGLAPDRTSVVVALDAISFGDAPPSNVPYGIGTIEDTQFQLQYQWQDGEFLSSFAWSRDSAKLAQLGWHELAVVQPNGTRGVVKRFADPNLVLNGVGWTADGQHLITAWRAAPEPNTTLKLQRINVANGSEQTLTTFSGSNVEFVVIP